MSKRLFLARKTHETIFILEEESNAEELKSQAEHYLREQDKWYKPPVEVTEITSKDQIPEGDWRGGALIWGVEDMTAGQFLDRYGSSEYQDYLRLKEKYEPKKK